MTEFAWASTETRKIVKGEERIVHFLDTKQTVRQTNWEHIYADACESCSLRTICGGLFDRGNAYDPAELYPVFVSRDGIVEAIIKDPHDPSYPLRTLDAWREQIGLVYEAEKPSGYPKTTISTEHGSVLIRLLVAGKLVARAIDDGTAGPVIAAAGRVGIRGDNAEFEFRDFQVRAV